ncbi:hypothetical protein AVEN_236958-1 [Araneus ventricosus]|uniref:Mariner Mos1 transposase n=1 Tax=Araneus ventricosus TaxID=182803 RepID=A0A4Y2LUM4_ARAVE|nr:hypothetical protein AVEN_236958-1 [Araneus ventricosus]
MQLFLVRPYDDCEEPEEEPSGVVLIHDNAHLHSAVVTQQLLEQFKWDMSDHPAYSPDLETSDFHLFPELKNWLGGKKLTNKASRKTRRFKAKLRPISHHWR